MSSSPARQPDAEQRLEAHATVGSVAERALASVALWLREVPVRPALLAKQLVARSSFF